MAQLRHSYEQMKERGAEIVVVGPEKRDAFAEHWREHNYPFVGLPDPRHEIADLYGQEVNLLKLGRLPTLILVDRDGRVRYQHHGNSMQDIPESDEILLLLEKLNEEADGQKAGWDRQRGTNGNV